ncbi:N-formylglutamate amidohydrolase [Pseudooceanicola nitratireducens]|uniref:N-formylglutamate amidohydrolase n=1 Tax=Pseudooceanicola nitratireducens TaxID=517719 RepID=UPI003108DB8A
MAYPPAIGRFCEPDEKDRKKGIVIVCEHASNVFPDDFGCLGLTDDQRRAHIAWDPGALGVARTMARELQGVLVSGRVSRLIYDCNRPPEAPSAFPDRSEIFDIPGNANLGADEKLRRVQQVYEPFREGLSEVLNSFEEAVIITVHSFTPVYHGKQRACEIGILHDADTRLADQLLEGWPDDAPLRATRNDPYGPEDGVTHTLKEHGISRGWRNVMLEIRNDLIGTSHLQDQVGQLLAARVSEALLAEKESMNG